MEIAFSATVSKDREESEEEKKRKDVVELPSLSFPILTLVL